MVESKIETVPPDPSRAWRELDVGDASSDHDTRRAFDRAVLSMRELAKSLEALDEALRRVRAEQAGYGLTNVA